MCLVSMKANIVLAKYGVGIVDLWFETKPLQPKIRDFNLKLSSPFDAMCVFLPSFLHCRHIELSCDCEQQQKQQAERNITAIADR